MDDRPVTPVEPGAGAPSPVPTAQSRRLFERANLVSPGGVQGEGRGGSPYPLFMTRAQGARITDVDGNEYVDFHASFGAVLLGHNDARINAAVTRAMAERGVSFSAANPYEVELAERLVSMVPSAERVVFSCSGTEATYHAIRLARAFTGRERILKFEGNYHGWHDYVAWSHHFATDDAGETPTPVAASAGIPAAVRDLVVVREYNDSAGVRETLAREGDSIAAVIVEPVFHNAGAILPGPGFLETLREACTDAGALLIFDEVITGFRHGVGGAQGRFGNAGPDDAGQGARQRVPDLSPLRPGEIVDRLGPKGDVLFAGTFAGHTLDVSAALECTRIVLEGDIGDHLVRLGRRLTAGIQAAIDETGVRVQVRESAGVWTIYFTDQPIRRFRDFARFAMDKDHPIQRAYRDWLLGHGIYVHPHYMIRGFLTGAHTDDDVDRLVDATTGFLRAHREQLSAS
jgi:glutamate-1-semialdehyde 2,1-aminomutase